MKILIVEDVPSLRELIQCSLEKERYVVETASDFNSALRKIEDYDYDCILLDIMLPEMCIRDRVWKDIHKSLSFAQIHGQLLHLQNALSL